MAIINDIATVIGLIRDILLIILLSVATFVLIAIAKKVIGITNSLRQLIQTIENILKNVSEKIVKPASSNPRVFRMFGRVLGFLGGFLRRSNS